MTDWVQLATQILTLIVVVVGAVKVYLVNRQVNELHVLVNSRLTELLELTAVSSRALGVKDATNHAAQQKEEGN